MKNNIFLSIALILISSCSTISFLGWWFRWGGHWAYCPL